MNLVFCLDDNFVQHFVITAKSIYENNTNAIINIYVLDGGISQQSKKLLSETLNYKTVNISYINLDSSLFKSMPVSQHVSVATYYRFQIPESLPLSVKKVIYLDCDIVVRGSLSALWDQDVNGYYLAAVPELFNERNIEMGLGNIACLNAGVMVLNLQKLREEGITKKLFDYTLANIHNIKHWDQDTLNAVIFKNWKQLPVRWNATTAYFRYYKTIKDKTLRNEINNPIIIHFNSSIKPWHYVSRHQYKALYYKYIANTPWRDYRPADRNALNFCKKQIGYFLHYLGVLRE